MPKGLAVTATYAGLLPSRRAVAAAVWRLGEKPDWDNWTVVLGLALEIETQLRATQPPKDGEVPWVLVL